LRKIFHELPTLREALERVLEKVSPLGVEEVDLKDALGRILASDMYAMIDSPPFDRSLVDGYAVRAEDIYQADEENPVELRLVGRIDVGERPRVSIHEGECAEISTGAPIPRGANAVVMVEYTSWSGDRVRVFRAVRPGENIAQVGSDISAGDLVLRRGKMLTAREIAALAALGYSKAMVYRRPRIAVFSIGRELVKLGQPLELGRIYDVNGYSILGLLAELGLTAAFKGILPDDESVILESLREALEESDVLITSGGTSAGLGDLTYRVFEKLGRVIVHGVRVKPGKPTIIAITPDSRLLVGLPGFPLSAMMIFISLVKPILLRLMGADVEEPDTIQAEAAFRLNLGGRTHLIPVHLVETPRGLRAYPVLGDSGSTSALLDADGFIEVPGEKQYLDEGEVVEVKLVRRYRPASTVIIGSHCPALDLLLDVAGLSNVKMISIGSLGGWYALKNGEADIAGTHLLDEETMSYNIHMPRRLGLEDEVEIYGGYIREIGFITAPGNPKDIRCFEDLLRPDVVFVNRVPGSGIRTFTDLQLRRLGIMDPERRIRGYTYQVRTHTAVAAAIAQGRADVGIAVGYVAKIYGLEFIHLADERFDIAVRRDRLYKSSVKAILEALENRSFAEKLSGLPHYKVADETGRRIYP
jgi:putative molybdopterin biosynthesis protein